eukprot:scaffold96136_cov19-Prasinocladus_malaysianus.AAC.2
MLGVSKPRNFDEMLALWLFLRAVCLASRRSSRPSLPRRWWASAGPATPTSPPRQGASLRSEATSAHAIYTMFAAFCCSLPQPSV